MLERESFKLVLACFLKLSFFCVFVGDFSSPPRSSGLAPNKGHEKRWHLGMARLLHGRTGHWWLCEHVSSAFKRHVRYRPPRMPCELCRPPSPVWGACIIHLRGPYIIHLKEACIIHIRGTCIIHLRGPT